MFHSFSSLLCDLFLYIILVTGVYDADIKQYNQKDREKEEVTKQIDT